MHEDLTNNNYMVSRQFISPERALALAQRFRNTKIIDDSDDQVEGSPAFYNFMPFLELLCEKTPEVSKLIGETVLPTYSYARKYQNKAILVAHKDRSACEISLTLNLDCDVEWPIWIKTPDDKSVAVTLQPGDAMLYLGKVAEHWRTPFTGTHCEQVFLHYVRSRGRYSWAYFDNEKPGFLK